MLAPSLRIRLAWESPLTLSSTYPGPVPLAVKQLVQLLDESARAISKTVANEVVSFLARVTTSRSLPPTISPGESGEAILHWIAGNQSLTVEVGKFGAQYAWLGPEHGSLVTPREIATASRSKLISMTAYTDRMNPTWRTRETF